MAPAAFVSLPTLVPTTRTYQAHRLPLIAKKGGSKKSRSNSRSKRVTGKNIKSSNSRNPKTQATPSSTTSDPLRSDISNDDSNNQPFPGPFKIDAPLEVPEVVSNNEIALSDDETLPVANEGKLKLPDRKDFKRKRKPRKSQIVEPSTVSESDESDPERMSSAKIRELTAAYRRGGVDAQPIIDQLEKNPDLMIQTGNPEGEYDLTSAIIGTGRPNQQGVYLLPYLQSGHILLLIIILLCTFIYYPGFPLTELDDSIRSALERGLIITFTFNAFLSLFSYSEAQKRDQPALFWTFKTAALGFLALQELKANAPLKENK